MKIKRKVVKKSLLLTWEAWTYCVFNYFNFTSFSSCCHLVYSGVTNAKLSDIVMAQLMDSLMQLMSYICFNPRRILELLKNWGT